MSADQPLTDDGAWIRGETEELSIAFTDVDGNAESATLFPTIELQVKKSVGDADPAVLSLALGSGITVLGDGTAKVSVTPTQSSAIPAGCWYYDVWVTKGDGSRKCAVGPSLLYVRDPVNLYP